ncbi:hypothetical protein OsI_28697 [Oryza sativa Indica Group]|uniref:F-box domain-containing protein n=1 Tax=Oryza sativa subsp. indica TaxID=39946 RepID=A2YTP8_ORYSI|nr:hypothetical protein OsI_28697 [Oryza sativa Indica Group]
MALPPPTPEVMDDLTASLAPELLSEILLRLPPDEPEQLFRAALVCKEFFTMNDKLKVPKWLEVEKTV